MKKINKQTVCTVYKNILCLLVIIYVYTINKVNNDIDYFIWQNCPQTVCSIVIISKCSVHDHI